MYVRWVQLKVKNSFGLSDFYHARKKLKFLASTAVKWKFGMPELQSSESYFHCQLRVFRSLDLVVFGLMADHVALLLSAFSIFVNWSRGLPSALSLSP